MEQSRQSRQSRQASILLVDDNRELLEALTEIFRFLGWTVHTASFGHEALNISMRFEPDVAIMDFHLGDMNGVEVVRDLRAAGSEMPVLLMTGLPYADVIAQALMTNIEGLVSKPFETKHIVQRIADIARRRGIEIPAAA